MISVNGNNYKPVTNPSVKPVVVDGVKYVPVTVVSPTKSVTPVVKKEDVNTFKIGNTTFVPATVIPVVYQPSFENKADKVPVKTSIDGAIPVKTSIDGAIPVKTSIDGAIPVKKPT